MNCYYFDSFVRIPRALEATWIGSGFARDPCTQLHRHQPLQALRPLGSIQCDRAVHRLCALSPLQGVVVAFTFHYQQQGHFTAGSTRRGATADHGSKRIVIAHTQITKPKAA